MVINSINLCHFLTCLILTSRLSAARVSSAILLFAMTRSKALPPLILKILGMICRVNMRENIFKSKSKVRVA